MNETLVTIGIGAVQTTVLFGLFYRMGRVLSKLEFHDTRLNKLEKTA